MTMVHSRLCHLALLFVAAACFLASGCLTTIDGSCTAIAETHCANCFECAADVEGVSGAQLCNIPANQDDTQSACETIVNDRCGAQARSVQDPFDNLDECDTATGEETCSDLVTRSALEQPGAPRVCQQFI